MGDQIACPNCGFVIDKTNARIRIQRTKLLLVEGKDAEIFWTWISDRVLQRKDIQILNFGGITEFRGFLKSLVLDPNFDQVETLIVIQDAENDAAARGQSIQDALKAARLAVPPEPFVMIQGTPKTAYMLHPGIHAEKGTLEDLCLKTIEDEQILNCVSEFLDCTRQKGEHHSQSHKNKLYSYLAGKANFAGLRLGEAASRGAWNKDSPALSPFVNIIAQM